jgi:outer membrane protein assembly factor BamD
MTGRDLRAVGLVLAVATVVLAGCRSGMREDPILALSAAEALVEGKQLLERERFGDARRYLAHAFEVEPNSQMGREALLLVADAHFLEGGADNLIQAEAKYRDFQNRFPTSDRGAYVQFQIANSLAGRIERADRDQAVTHKAQGAYEELLRIYPTSEYAVAARQKIEEVRLRLADHEYEVGRFYMRYGIARAAALRFEYLLANFPGYERTEETLFHLVRAYDRSRQLADAARIYQRLAAEYPQSERLRELAKDGLPRPVPAEEAPPAKEAAAGEEKAGA